MLVKLVTDHGVVPTVVVWDAGSSGRKEVYPAYKGTRSSQPDLLREQWPSLSPLVEAFGYTNYKLDGYEADDVIATLAERAKGEGIPVVIVTGDRDAFQLCGDGVRVMATARGITETKMYDAATVQERYGIGPELIPDFYGLKGDTSDNIPGIPGIGEKTATDLLQRFGDLETILASVDQISGAKRKENLVNHAEDARISKVLATVKRDLPVTLDLHAELVREPDRSRLRELFRDFELRDPLRRLEEALGDEDAAPRPETETALALPVRRAAAADIPSLRGDEVAVAALAPVVPEGELLAETEAWRFGAWGGQGEAVAGEVADPAEIAAALGRPARDHPRRQGAAGRARQPRLRHGHRRLPARPGPARLPAARDRRGARHRRHLRRRAGLGGGADPRARRPPARADPRARPRGPAHGHRAAAREGPALHGGAGHQARRRPARHARLAHQPAGRGARAGDLGDGRRGVRHRLPAAARPGALREARPVQEAPRQDRLLHGRARAAGHPRRARDHPEDREVPGAVQARADVLRDAEGAHRRRRPAAHDLRPDDGRDRAAVDRGAPPSPAGTTSTWPRPTAPARRCRSSSRT